MEIILASRSVARRKLLENLGFKVKIVVPEIEEEKAFTEEDAPRVVVANALEKVKKVVIGEKIVIGADTLVCINGKVLGKPSSIDEVRKFLHILRGRWHRVYSGYAIWIPRIGYRTGIDVARVKMRSYTDEEINYYIESQEPLGKAGAYALQGLGMFLVEKIEGNPSTIVGLPIHKVVEELRFGGYWPTKK